MMALTRSWRWALTAAGPDPGPDLGGLGLQRRVDELEGLVLVRPGQLEVGSDHGQEHPDGLQEHRAHGPGVGRPGCAGGQPDERQGEQHEAGPRVQPPPAQSPDGVADGERQPDADDHDPADDPPEPLAAGQLGHRERRPEVGRGVEQDQARATTAAMAPAVSEAALTGSRRRRGTRPAAKISGATARAAAATAVSHRASGLQSPRTAPTSSGAAGGRHADHQGPAAGPERGPVADLAPRRPGQDEDAEGAQHGGRCRRPCGS